MTDTATSIETPCIQVCVLDPASRLCIGCGRSIEEIAGWIAFDDKARAQIMAELRPRLERMAGPAAATATA